MYGSRALSSGSAPHGAPGASGEQGNHDCGNDAAVSDRIDAPAA